MTSAGKFVKGAAVLAFTGVIIKVIGAVMRIALAALIGDDGIGLYQMAYPIYSTLFIISTAGIPVAVSKLVSESIALKDYRGAFRVFQMSLVILTLTGLLITLALALGSDIIAREIAEDHRAYWSILFISPAIFFVTVMSAFRGFFQGQHQMVPTAVSQLLEQVARVTVSIGLAVLLLPLGLRYSAAGAAFGAAAGGMAGLLVLLIFYFKQRSSFSRQVERQPYGKPFAWKEILFRIWHLSIPVTLGALIIPLSNIIDLSIVPSRLHDAGFGIRATALYGQLTGMAKPIIQFPIVLITALKISIVPAVSEASSLNNNQMLKQRVETSLRLTLLFSLPAAAGLFLLSEPVCIFLYDNAQAAYPLSILAWGVIFLSLYLITTGIHYGMGLPLIPVKNMGYGGLVKIIGSWYLTAVPALNIGGAALATVLGFIVASVLNIYSLTRLIRFRFNPVESAVKPLVATALMSVTVWAVVFLVDAVAGASAVSPRGLSTLVTLAAIMAGSVSYTAALWFMGALKEDDLRMIPRVGERISRWLKRVSPGRTK